MELINQTTYDKPTLDALNRITRQTIQKNKTQVIRITCFVVGGAGLVLGILLGQRPGFPPVAASLIVLYGLILFAASLFWNRFQTWTSGRMMSQGLKKCTFTFQEDALLVENEVGSTRYAYRRFSALAEDDQWFVLYLDFKHGMILNKQGFLSGNADQAHDHLEANTGLQFKRP